MFRVQVRTGPSMPDDATLARIGEVLAASPLENAEVVLNDARGFGEISFDLEAETYDDAVDLGHRALRRIATEEAGIRFSFWSSPLSARARARVTRNASKNIRASARRIMRKHGSPLTELERITSFARMTVPPHTPYRWPEAPIWPLYRRFHALALCWEETKAVGYCPDSLRTALEHAVVAEAERLVASQAQSSS